MKRLLPRLGPAVSRSVEGILDVPRRVVTRVPVPDDVRQLVEGLCGYAKQLVRSRALRAAERRRR